VVVEFEHRNVLAQLAPESAHTIVCGTRNHTHARANNWYELMGSQSPLTCPQGQSAAGCETSFWKVSLL